MTKVKIIKKKIKKEPFDNHCRTKEKNLPFLRASRVLITDPHLKVIFKGLEYTGENQLGAPVQEEEEGFLDVEAVLKTLLFEIAKCRSSQLKEEKEK